MIFLSAEKLRNRIDEIFQAAGTPAGVSKQVSESLVESNLVGHDSHGAIRVPGYVEWIKDGTLHPEAKITAVRESATTALLDCGFLFGQVACTTGMDLAISKARQHDLGMVVLRHCNHTGRIGEYAVRAAEQGLVGFVFCNGSIPGGIVAPFGGVGRALGANPLAWAVPRKGGRPIFLDLATSVVAHGKIMVAADKGEKVPEGWILDRDGKPSTNPQDMLNGGPLLPLGGHKGYALSVMIELLGGGLSGVGYPLVPGYTWDQGTVLVAVNIEAFQPPDEFKRGVEAFAERMKTVPRAEGCPEILLPGEPEWRCRELRMKEGVPLPEATWDRIREVAEKLGLGRD
jgi:LDH2 family malate/lactate/ureidoglycolate dehydrogenase